MKTTFHIEGLACQGCAKAVETILSKEESILSVEVHLQQKEVVIESHEEVDMKLCNEALEVRGFVLSK